MKEWEFDELFDAVQETYGEFINKERGYRYAIARTFDEFDNLGSVEDLIVHTAIGEIILLHDKVFVGNYEAINTELKNFNVKELENELTKDETKRLLEKIEVVLKELENIKIDYNPNSEIETRKFL